MSLTISTNHRSDQAGFTLVEVLVTLMVLSIGLLGLAGLHATSLRASGSAYMLTQATMLANDMADRMRANIPGVNGNAYNDLHVEAALSEGDTCYATACTTAIAAANADQVEWGNALAQADLPAAEGDVDCQAGICTITVSWDTDRDGAADIGHSIRIQP